MRSPLITAFLFTAAASLPGCSSLDGDKATFNLLEDDVYPDVCTNLGFDLDGDGNAIAAGAAVDGAYASIGVSITTTRRGGGDGLGVAFDSANPTGGDDDLAFDGLGNLLITQESFSDADRAAGAVAEPDDNGSGGGFDFAFASEACLSGITILDVDDGEEPVRITLFGADGAQVGSVGVNPTGNNTRQDVVLDACGVHRMTVELFSSGAVDNIGLCTPADIPEGESPGGGDGGGGDDNDVCVDADNVGCEDGGSETGRQPIL